MEMMGAVTTIAFTPELLVSAVAPVALSTVTDWLPSTANVQTLVKPVALWLVGAAHVPLVTLSTAVVGRFVPVTAMDVAEFCVAVAGAMPVTAGAVGDGVGVGVGVVVVVAVVGATAGATNEKLVTCAVIFLPTGSTVMGVTWA